MPDDLFDEIERQLRQSSMIQPCPRCKKSNWKYLHNFGVWQRQTERCAYMVGRGS